MKNMAGIKGKGKFSILSCFPLISIFFRIKQNTGCLLAQLSHVKLERTQFCWKAGHYFQCCFTNFGCSLRFR
uniref:Uncharacterized protein n=1 Tax=Rhizophora mucronata TaxID=61149 RepID=A0A2P2MYW8_RHIMU